MAIVVALGLSCDPIAGDLPEPPDPLGGVRQLWRVQLQRAARYHLPATDGTYFYAETNRQVAAYDVQTGELLWALPRETETAPKHFVVQRDLLLYAADVAVARRTGDGEVVWRFRPDSGSGSLGDSAADEDGFYFGTNTHRVYAVELADGALRWSVDVGPDWQYRGNVRGVSVSGDTVYVGVEQYLTVNGEKADGWIIALSRHTGDEIWRYRRSSGGHSWINSAPRVAGRFLLGVDYPENTYLALDRLTGAEVWHHVGEAGRFGAEEPPRVAGDTAFGASQDLFVTAFDLQSGRMLWRTATRAGNRAMALCGSRILTSLQGLAVLDRRSGALLGYGIDDGEDFLTTDFAVAGNVAFVAGTRAAYGLQCP
jgi:outer membrane protein assembly factor BamB